ncbi:MAG: carbon-nitrogen hydrolase [Deltaproteobacteria bacterium]|nr:carbon-nitrogen hydrolase [Deltaproteobacteria bacterium]
MANNRVTVGLIQSRASLDPDRNLAATARRIRLAAEGGARIVCVQELFRSRYFPQTEDTEAFALAEPIPGPTTECFSPLARELEVVIVASVFEARAPGVYHNTALVIDADGQITGRYRKMHIPDDPGFHEKFYFAPGDLGFRTFRTRHAQVAVLICWDQWFPEAARLAALGGAEIIFYPTAIGWGSGENRTERRTQLEAWELVQRSHAVTNGVYVAAVNRVGREGKITFWGNSFVSDPSGRVLARAAGNKPETLLVDCALGSIAEARQNWPFLRDRRIDAYGGLTKQLLD